MARTRYPCEGCITIRFLAKKGVVNLLYKHHSIHRSPHDKIEDAEDSQEPAPKEGAEKPKEPAPDEPKGPGGMWKVYEDWQKTNVTLTG
jgi:hypothetical protein